MKKRYFLETRITTITNRLATTDTAPVQALRRVTAMYWSEAKGEQLRFPVEESDVLFIVNNWSHKMLLNSSSVYPYTIYTYTCIYIHANFLTTYMYQYKNTVLFSPLK